jgi:MFS transporter, MHS family, proline/betaine transporter
MRTVRNSYQIQSHFTGVHYAMRYRNTLLASLGSALEYYDFVLYALLASYLSQHFFPTHDPLAGLIETMLIFAVGYLVRPLGGVIFGHLGDTLGRKQTFTFIILLMAIATGGIGLLPGYSHWGILAPLSLALLRICQGLSQGAELPGAMTFVSEHANTRRRGLQCGLVLLGISLGATGGSMIIWLLTRWLTSEQMMDWGWRIPFLLGGLLAIVGYYLRRQSLETPLFKQMPTACPAQPPIWQVLTHQRGAVLRGFAITVLSAALVLFNLFIPAFLATFYQYDSSTIYAAMSIGLIWSGLCLVIFGWLSDHLGRTRLLRISAIATMLAIVPIFHLLGHNTFYALLMFNILYQTLIAGLAACYVPILTELFPTQTRFSGFALTYNLAFSVAAFIPILLTWLANTTAYPPIVAWFFVIFACIPIIGSLLIKDMTRQQLQ